MEQIIKAISGIISWYYRKVTFVHKTNLIKDERNNKNKADYTISLETKLIVELLSKSPSRTFMTKPVGRQAIITREKGKVITPILLHPL